MTNEELEAEITLYKELLKESDYKTLKYVDGAISEAEYKQIKADRANWRERINEYEAQLGE